MKAETSVVLNKIVQVHLFVKGWNPEERWRLLDRYLMIKAQLFPLESSLAVFGK